MSDEKEMLGASAAGQGAAAGQEAQAAAGQGTAAGQAAAGQGAAAGQEAQVAANALPVEFPCEKDGVLKLLPHRDPFVWVSRVLSCEPGKSVVAELDVDPDLALFKGHFPGHPVLPGVILMEALAQAASICVLVQDGKEGSLGYLVGIDKAKFRRTVLPGDTVTLKGTITKNSSRMCVAEVEASVDGEVCATAVQKYVIAPGKKSEGGNQ